MCVLCAMAGKPAGDFGCLDASSSAESGDPPEASAQHSADGNGANNYASHPNGVANYETSGSDAVTASTLTSSNIAAAASIRGYVNTAGDQDWYGVDLVVGHQYTFELSGFGKGALPDAFLRLLGASGNELASNDDSGPLAGSELTYTAAATGTYYISAGGYGASKGQYLLTMNEGATPFTPAVSVADAADYLTNTYWEVSGQHARHWASSTITYNDDELAPARAALVHTAFQLWSDVAGLNFVETHGSANITFDDSQPGSFSNSSVTSDGVITSSMVNVNSAWYGGISAVDSYTLQTFIHEIGHAIGLGHAGAYNGAAIYGVDNVYANDTWQMSVMSYMPQADYGDATYRFTMTPMMADIMATQEMYGAPATRSGDTVYGFGSTAGSIYDFATYTSAPALTIYDSGGHDTLNASGYGDDQIIDLRAGQFSNIGGLNDNVCIYLTTVIENAVGGSGNDTIIGNTADNTITGGSGNDAIDGGDGTDSAIFSGARTAYTLTALDGSGVRVSGPDGTDTFTNVEKLVFDDQIVTWAQAPQADVHATSLTVANATIYAGNAATIGYTVTNTGTAAATNATVAIYWSSDAVLDGSDTMLTARSAPTLDVGASFHDNFALTLSQTGHGYLIAAPEVANANSGASGASAAVQVTVAAAPEVATPVPVVTPPASHAVSGTDGNDTLVVDSSHNAFDGGAGDDTVVFSQTLDKYSVTDLGTKILVSGPDGTETLTNIENLKFADGTIHANDGDPLFDTVYYMTHNLDVFHTGVDALDHFNTFGWHEGRDPNAYFSMKQYLAANQDVAASGANPLQEFRQTGWQEGRDPSANFDTTLYLQHNADVAAAGIDPLEHYLQYGRAEGRAAYGELVNGFDAQYYLANNPDVAAAGVDPLWHFDNIGWKEGRNPDAYFGTAGYLAHNPDVAAAGVNPLDHYEDYGWREGREPSGHFDTDGYLAANPDVAAAGVNPLNHYLEFGVYEGRAAVNDGLWHI